MRIHKTLSLEEREDGVRKMSEVFSALAKHKILLSSVVNIRYLAPYVCGLCA